MSDLASWCAQWGVTDTATVDLLSQLLRYDGAARLTTREALQHEYFWSGAEVCCMEDVTGARGRLLLLTHQ